MSQNILHSAVGMLKSYVKVYITKPSDYPHLPSKLLLLLSSGTGIHSKNNQLQADKYASEGFLVVMPDQCVYSPPYLRCVTDDAVLVDSLGTQLPRSVKPI